MISDDLIKKVTGQYDLELIQRLNLDNFGLKSVGNLSRMTSLRELSVARNDVSDISPLAELVELRGLNLADNIIRNIDCLGSGEGGFENLEVLDLSGNHRMESLAKVVEILKRLPSLRRLSLKSSPAASGGAPPMAVTDFQKDIADPNKYPLMIFEELPNIQILDGAHVMIMKASMGPLGISSPGKGSANASASMGEEKDNDVESGSWIDLTSFHTEGMDYSPRKNAVLGSIEDKKRDALDLLKRGDQAMAM